VKPEEKQTYNQPSFQCAICEGSGFISFNLQHSKYCEDSGVCIGRKFCPVLVREDCTYCEDGLVKYDYCFYQVSWVFTFSKADEKRIKKHWRKTRRKAKREIKEKQYELCKFLIAPEISYQQRNMILGVAAFSFNQSLEIIKPIMLNNGIPIHKAETEELFSSRIMYGMCEPYGASSYYDKTICENYNEWKNQTGKIDEILDSESKHRSTWTT